MRGAGTDGAPGESEPVRAELRPRGTAATSGGLATSVRVVCVEGVGGCGRRSGARPLRAAPEAGVGSGGATVGIARGEGSGD